MKRLLLILVLPIVMINLAVSQIIYEDFEGGSGLSWEGINGSYDGIVANPDSSAINPSDNCGSFTKPGDQAWSFMVTELDAAMDLSVNNKFFISVYSPVATQILFKLEGTGGAVEVWQNIANANTWQEYSFDLSAQSDNTGLEKIVVFFNPGETDDGATYLVDNIRAEPADACAGTTPDPLIIDDYECQRNATYGGGWDIIVPVANPDPSGINTSDGVGQYTDPIDEWSALVIDYNNSLDLSTNNNIKAKVWAPRTGRILMKLEGGVSPAAEIFIDVTETETWVEYTADFSSEANADHKKIAIFFNAGVLADSGDVYFIDDVIFAEGPGDMALEDFEDGANLDWGPLNGDQTNHGTFDGVKTNPDQSGVNDSENIGQYSKGDAAFSTLTAFLPGGLDLSASPQLNLQVLAPVGSETVTMQLASPTQGTKDVTRDITDTEVWIQLEFNFEEFDDVTDFERVNLLFDGGTASSGTLYLYDNLIQGTSTVDPCENVDVVPTVLDDYECQRNVVYGAGGDRLSVVDNPDVSAENSSSAVGEYMDPLDEWSALGFESGSSWDLTVFNQFAIKIWSPMAVPVLFKLEGGSSPAIEVWMDITETEKWVDYTIDFGTQASEDHARIVIFFNAGQLPGEETLYYIDNVQWKRLNYSGCVNDHEGVNSTIGSFQYFANGHIEQEDNRVRSVENPNPSGINDSENVGKFVKAFDGTTFSGAFAPLGAPIEFGGNKTIRAKVLMDHIGNFALKIEGSATGAAPIELAVENTLVDEWEELTFDFSDAPDDAQYETLTLFFDLTIEPAAEDVTSYFDDFVIGDGNCPFETTGVFNPVNVEEFKIFPNPVTDVLMIENTLEMESIEVYNYRGQLMLTERLGYAGQIELQVSSLGGGMYFIAGYNKEGRLMANAKFVKL